MSIEALLSLLDDPAAGPPRLRPDGASLLTRRDRQVISEVNGDCGASVADGLELNLIAERQAERRVKP